MVTLTLIQCLSLLLSYSYKFLFLPLIIDGYFSGKENCGYIYDFIIITCVVENLHTLYTFTWLVETQHKYIYACKFNMLYYITQHKYRVVCLRLVGCLVSQCSVQIIPCTYADIESKYKETGVTLHFLNWRLFSYNL